MVLKPSSPHVCTLEASGKNGPSGMCGARECRGAMSGANDPSRLGGNEASTLYAVTRPGEFSFPSRAHVQFGRMTTISQLTIKPIYSTQPTRFRTTRLNWSKLLRSTAASFDESSPLYDAKCRVNCSIHKGERAGSTDHGRSNIAYNLSTNRSRPSATPF